ncbi:DEKNAAC100329 [Brettanomyces naardenensis]|uniref:Anaphase-promoting complex subunit 4 n=1 Tax=Brettanomyces naardenensis TaxID=13370 RepID=A0A448YFC8_BRENA|nr:DEKNAAC100329 [Brettanomyces naardenensis]
MVKLDTDFVSRYGSKLPLISHTCSRLVGLISCLKESIDHMNTDYKPFADYTTRIIDLLKGEIDEKNQKDYSDDPVYDLYDLLLTGSLSDATRTWLTDYLGDRGIKRWVKLGRQHFEGSRKTMFYDMIPALQHLLVHLSSLQGLSKWEETTDLLGLDSNKINTSIETASTFLKACYKTMMTLNEEQKNFESVMEWLDAIVQEVMTDEKPTIQIKTQNIIQFLLSIFNKSGARQKNGDLQVLFDSLSSDLVGIFQRIKDKMKSQMSSESVAVLAEDTEGMLYWEAKLYGEFGILAVSSREKIELVKFDIDSLKSNKTILQGVGNPQSLLASLMEDGSNIIVLASYEREARLALLRLGEESTNSILEGNAAMVKSITLPEEEGTVATYITNNSKRQTCCLLDSTRKRYIVLEY